MKTSIFADVAARIASVPRRVKVIVGAVVVLLVIALAVPAVLMSQPGVLGRVDEFADNHSTLTTSVHAELACGDCHDDAAGRVGGTLALVGDFYRTVFSPGTEPVFIEFESPKAQACLECHHESWSEDAERTTRVPHPAHLRLSEETRECVECHKWAAHQEEYQEEHKTMPFSGVCAAYECHAGFKTMDECADCHHTLLEDPTQWKSMHPVTVMSRGDGGCLELCHEIKQCQQCHTTGENPFEGLAGQTDRDAIEEQHAQPDWMRVHGVRALDDQSACLSCHISVGPCQNCHARRPAMHGPEGTWIAAHKDAVQSDRQCLTCHEQSYCDHCHDQFKEMR